MRKMRLLFLSVLLILLFAGCNKSGTLPIITKATPLISKATPLPTPKKGTAIVTGTMIDKAGKKPLGDQLVRLSKIYGEGKDAIYVYNESSDPGTYTAETGFFVFTDVNPGSYAVILIDNNGNYSPIIENADKIITVDAVEDKVISMGDITVDLESSGNK